MTSATAVLKMVGAGPANRCRLMSNTALKQLRVWEKCAVVELEVLAPALGGDRGSDCLVVPTVRLLDHLTVSSLFHVLRSNHEL